MPWRFRRYLPLFISVALVVVLVAYTPWNDVGSIADDISLASILGLLGLSILYYGLKTLRFWYLLKAMDIHQPLSIVGLSYLSAQPVSLLPGGELYRSRTLERHTGVPMQRSVAQFTMQGVLEGSAMVTLAIISAIFLGKLRVPFICLGVVIVVGIVLINRNGVANLGKILNRVPFLEIEDDSLKHLNRHHKAVMRWQWFSWLYALSICIELVGSAVALLSVASLGGHISVAQAVLVYVIPVIVGFVSFLPAGLGISEQSAVGIMLLSSVSIATAVASTLLMRITIVGTGLAYGAAALFFGRRRLKRLQPARKRA